MQKVFEKIIEELASGLVMCMEDGTQNVIY